MRPDRVWYLAYGSNLHADRFARYLQGGPLEPGARDRAPARADRWHEVPCAMTFAKQSTKWSGGGVAFLCPDAVGVTIVRAWDISGEQFEDLFAQENRRRPGPDEPELDWQSLRVGRSVDVGQGWYARLQPIDVPIATAEQPALTFTWTEPAPYNAPNPAYLDTMRSGLRQNPDLDECGIEEYLAGHGSGGS